MHIFNISVIYMYLHSVEKIQWKPYEKNPESLSKNIFSASNFFMHIFNISVACLQSVEKIQWKLLRGVDFTSMYYQL